METFFQGSQQEPPAIWSLGDWTTASTDSPPMFRYTLCFSNDRHLSNLCYFDRHLASHEVAYKQTHGLPGLATMHGLIEQTSWGTASLRNSTSGITMAGGGFATAISVVSGKQYWVLFKQRTSIAGDSLQGDLQTAEAFPPLIYDPLGASSEIFEHEGILLSPGMVL